MNLGRDGIFLKVFLGFTPAIALLSVANQSAFAMGKVMAPSPSPTSTQTSSDPSSPVMPNGASRAIIFGGSCDDGARQNSFLGSLNLLASGLVKSGWDVHPLYEGDIARCTVPSSDGACQGSAPSADCCPSYADMSGWSVDSLAAASGKPASSIGRASVQNLLNSLDQASQDLKSGDQLLVAINTHGFGYAQPGTTKTKHYICVSSDAPHGRVTWTDPNSGSAASGISGLFSIDDPRLQTRLQALKDAGIKLAFLDDSCNSGGSVPSFSQYGCVMTATGSQQENVSQVYSGTVVVGSKTTMASSGTDTFYNLADLLNSQSSQLSPLSLGHAHHLTMEELWLRMLSHSRMSSDTPEFSGYLDEQKSVDDLNTWLNTLTHDVAFHGQNSPLSNCTNCTKDSSQPLEDYASQFLSPELNSSNDQNYLRVVQNYWAAPGYSDQFDDVQPVDPSSMNSKLSSTRSAWNALESQYSALVSQESSSLQEIKSVNMNIQLDFSGALAGTADLFNSVVSKVNGTSVFFYPVSDNGPGLLEVMDSFSTPDSPDFSGTTQAAADALSYQMNAYKLQHDAYVSGLSSDYAPAFASMLVQAETSAWNSLSVNSRNLVKKDFQTLASLRKQERVLLTELPLNARVDLVEARMYSYLGFRDTAGRTNSNLNGCSDFTLKNY
jgi:hypothetical protein